MIDVVELCRELVRLPSVGSVHGEGAVVRHLVGVLAPFPAVGYEIVEARPGRPNLLCRIDSGRPGPALVLNGHTDTYRVDPADWSADPHSGALAGGHVWGRGAADMKGGLAALVAATVALLEAGGPPVGSVLLSATADEDGEGRWGVPWLIEEGLIVGDAAIIAEPAGVHADYEHLYAASRGYAYASVEIHCPPGGHSSLYVPERPHAVALACRLLEAIERDFRPAPTTHPLFPAGPTVIAGDRFSGGEELGSLAERATFSVAARLLPGAARDSFVPELEAFVAAALPGVDATVAFGGFPDSWGPPLDLGGEHALVRAALDAVRAAGYGDAQIAGWPAFTEASFLAAAGIPALPGLGPGRIEHAHRPDERVSASSLRASVAIYLDLFGRILCERSIVEPRSQASAPRR
jgi:acetylornithine deacetylase/succinyl-diaminopimelate desuccinylase-like protein